MGKFFKMRWPNRSALAGALTLASSALMLSLFRLRSTYPMIPHPWTARAEMYLFWLYVASLYLFFWWLSTRNFNKGIRTKKVIVLVGVLLGAWILSSITYGAMVGVNAAISSEAGKICLVARDGNNSPDGLISREKSIAIKPIGSDRFSYVYFRRNSVDLSNFPIDTPICVNAFSGPFGYRLYQP